MLGSTSRDQKVASDSEFCVGNKNGLPEVRYSSGRKGGLCSFIFLNSRVKKNSFLCF